MKTKDKTNCQTVLLGNVYGAQFGTGYAGNVWDKDSFCPTLRTMQGGGNQPMVIVKEETNEKK